MVGNVFRWSARVEKWSASAVGLLLEVVDAVGVLNAQERDFKCKGRSLVIGEHMPVVGEGAIGVAGGW